jgi:hypothetical protein
MLARVRGRIGLAGLSLTVLLLFGLALAQEEMALYANGVRIPAPCLVRDGVAYVPAQALAGALGISVQWNSNLNQVKINGVTIEATPVMQDGRVYVPVEALARASDTTVEWDGANRRILLNTKGGPPPPPAPTALKTPLPAFTPTPDPYGPSAPSPQPVTARGTNPNVVSDPSWVSPGAVPSIAQNLPPNMRAPILDMTLPSPTTAPMTGEYISQSGNPGLAPTQPRAIGDVFVPRSSQNSIFMVTVTNLQSVNSLKEFYKPRGGHKFVIVYLSQQNISNEVQIYTGKFNLVDQSGNAFNGLDNLSNFWLVVLRPHGINFGYLVFEVPQESVPAQIVLTTANQPPLSLPLQ